MSSCIGYKIQRAIVKYFDPADGALAKKCCKDAWNNMLQEKVSRKGNLSLYLLDTSKQISHGKFR
jgi:hypothetical protein